MSPKEFTQKVSKARAEQERSFRLEWIKKEPEKALEYIEYIEGLSSLVQ